MKSSPRSGVASTQKRPSKIPWREKKEACKEHGCLHSSALSASRRKTDVIRRIKRVIFVIVMSVNVPVLLWMFLMGLRIPGTHYCGMGNEISDANGIPFPPYNELDKYCRGHDVVYETVSSHDEVLQADILLFGQCLGRFGSSFKETLQTLPCIVGMAVKVTAHTLDIYRYPETFTVMYFNKRIEKSAMKTKQNFSCNQATNQDPSAIYENPPVLQTDETFDIKTVSKNIDAETTFRPNSPTDSHSTSSSGSEGEEPFHPFKPPKESILSKFWWYLMWPSNILLSLTVPDVRRPSCVKFYIVSFIMSIFWIGGLTYVAVWMITIIGYTFGAPDTVMGITILAAGSSIPEAVSSIIVSRQGKGSMAISNSIGSNSFDILICLGLPWLIKAAALSSDGAVHVNSKGVGYSAIMLFGSVILLYVAIVLNKFKLDRKLGFIFLISYILFLVIASLTEMNVFFLVNQPQCRDC